MRLVKSLSIKWQVTSTSFPSRVRQQEIVDKRLVIVIPRSPKQRGPASSASTTWQ